VDASNGDSATRHAHRTSDASTVPISVPPDATPTLLDAASLCTPLVCPDDGGCSKLVWPFDPYGSQCDPTGLGAAHGYVSPTMSIGCGLVVMSSGARAGNFSQTIYDETTGTLLGTRQNVLGTFNCEDSRPDARRRTTKPETAPTCNSARVCYPCRVSGTADRPSYTCQSPNSTQFYQWSPFDAD
jgi:hypothetical protein